MSFCSRLLLFLFLSMIIGGCGGGSTGTGSVTVDGRLLLQSNDAPLADVLVRVENSTVSTFTDENGEFVLNTKFAGGDIRLLFSGAGLQADYIVSDVSPDAGTIRLDLKYDDTTEEITADKVEIGKDTQKETDSHLERPNQDEASPLPGSGETGSNQGGNEGEAPESNSPTDPGDEFQSPENNQPSNPNDSEEPGEDGASTTPPTSFLRVILGTETVLNPAAESDSYSIRSGDWFDPSIWSTGVVPGEDQLVQIADGTIVNYNSSTATVIDSLAVNPGGTLRFDPNINTRLQLTTLLVHEGGTLEIGTSSQPIAPNVQAEIVFSDVPFSAEENIEQHTHGLLGFGKVQMHGAAKNVTWREVAKDLHAGDTEILLNAPISGWEPGMTIAIPDTRQVPNWLSEEWTTRVANHSEEAVIAEVVGNRILLTEPLAFDHLGGRDTDGALQFLPHVALLSRNVILRSENPDGNRGHVFFSGRAEVDLRYSRFQDLGRTDANEVASNTIFTVSVHDPDLNRDYVFRIIDGHLINHRSGRLPDGYSARISFGKIVVRDRRGTVMLTEEIGDTELTALGNNQTGRYALHLKGVRGPENSEEDYQFTLIGNTVDRARKWGYVLQDSSHGLIQDNVSYAVDGAAFITPEGSEVENYFLSNFAMQVRAGTSAGEQWSGVGNFANRGVGFWARRTGNHYHNNVVTNAHESGWKITSYLKKEVSVPKTKGSEPHKGPNQRVPTNINPSGSFDQNEVYGMTKGGLWSTFSSGSSLDLMSASIAFNSFSVWHVHGNAVDINLAKNIKLSGLKILCDLDATTDFGSRHPDWHWGAKGIRVAGRFTDNVTVEDSQIDGCLLGIEASSGNSGGDAGKDGFLINNALLRNYINIRSDSSYSGLGLEVRDVLFEALPVANFRDGTLPRNIDRKIKYDRPGEPPMSLNRVRVFNYNGVLGDDFQIYLPEQAPDILVPDYSSPVFKTPLPGLTNLESYRQFGIAIAGEPAPCADTREGIAGFVCSDPTSIPSMLDPEIVQINSDTFHVSFSTNEVTEAQVELWIRGEKVPSDHIFTEWSSFRADHFFEITNVPAKHYNIRVRARNAAGELISQWSGPH